LFDPTLAQVNTVCGIVLVVIAQLSELDAVTESGVTVTLPVASKLTVGLEQTGIGAVTSLTVIEVLQVAEFPDGSVMVTVCVLIPISAQVKSVLGIDGEVPQLSKLPEDTLAAVTVTLPVESKLTVGLVHIGVGAVMSLTVIVVLQVAVLPDPSFKVTVCVLAPVLAQVNVFLGIDCDTIPQLSLLVPEIEVVAIVTEPVEGSRLIVGLVQMALGGVMSWIVITVLQVCLLPEESVTVTVSE
jgi:hypothetical protein